MALIVSPVSSAADLRAFIQLPRRLYREDKYWIAPLDRLQREEFSAKHSPFYGHADVQLFLAHDDGRVVGRITAQVDHEHNRVHGERTGFFGFFESENDEKLAQALLESAERWLLDRGMERIRGPLGFSLNGISGVLIEGFDSSPTVMMPYNPPHYAALLEASGYSKVKDLYAWRYSFQEISARAMRMVNVLRNLPEVHVRTLEMSNLRREMVTILDVVNSAWSDNWGFVPLTEDEARKFADDFKLIADPALVPIVEIDGTPAAVALCLPDLNEAIADLDGRLFPFGLLKLLWRLKVRGLHGTRLILLGVRKEYRTRKYAGLPYLLGHELYLHGKARGYDRAEFSWTLEDNGLINAMIQHMGCVLDKKYRIYEKALNN